MKEEVSKNFNKTHWVYKAADSTSKREGLSISSLRAVSLLNSDGEKNSEYKGMVNTAYQRILKQGINETGNDNENKFYIISSSAKYQPD